MNLFVLYIFYLQLHSHQSLVPPIQKTCSNCKYFNPNNNECRKIGEIDIITGKITNERASTVRYDEKKCGKEGKYFEKNYFKLATIPYYFTLKYGKFILSISYGFLPLILWFFLTK
jgi:hypothetical protein